MRTANKCISDSILGGRSERLKGISPPPPKPEVTPNPPPSQRRPNPKQRPHVLDLVRCTAEQTQEDVLPALCAFLCQERQGQQLTCSPWASPRSCLHSKQSVRLCKITPPPGGDCSTAVHAHCGAQKLRQKTKQHTIRNVGVQSLSR